LELVGPYFVDVAHRLYVRVRCLEENLLP